MPERPTTAHEVWTILVEECGADGDEEASAWCAFEHVWPCNEFRFCGDLGFGGKVRWHASQNYASVDCYPEDRTPERDEKIRRANVRLHGEGWA